MAHTYIWGGGSKNNKSYLNYMLKGMEGGEEQVTSSTTWVSFLSIDENKQKTSTAWRTSWRKRKLAYHIVLETHRLRTEGDVIVGDTDWPTVNCFQAKIALSIYLIGICRLWLCCKSLRWRLFVTVSLTDNEAKELPHWPYVCTYGWRRLHQFLIRKVDWLATSCADFSSSFTECLSK